jgi:hypothetical protein
MDKNEFFIWFGQQVQSRWPDWQVNDITLNDWFFAFGRFDKALLTRAIQRHKINDDTSRPRIRKIFAIIKKLLPAPQEPPPDDQCSGDNKKRYTFNQYWQMIRSTWSKQKRIENMLGWYKWYPKAKKMDPEAYDWVVKEIRPANDDWPNPNLTEDGIKGIDWPR